MKKRLTVDFIPLTGQSKKQRREYYGARRGSWNGVNPVTKVVPSGRTYDRKREKRIGRRLSDDLA